MKKIFTIILLVISITAYSQGNFFMSHNSSTSCRPDLLTTFVLNYTIYNGTEWVTFSDTYDEACAALYNHVVNGWPLLSGIYVYHVEALSLMVGASVYMYEDTTDCTKQPDGYYFSVMETIGDPIYHIVNGVITEILYCYW